MQRIQTAEPPRGFKLWLFRLPIYLYRLGLGFLLGQRVVYLQHRGRKSGLMREVVLEVIDKDKQAGRIYCASGYGEHSQWFKNIVADKNVMLIHGRDKYLAKAQILEAEEASEILLKYAKAHPRAAKAVARLSGYKINGSEEDIIEFSKLIRIVAFTDTNRNKTGS